MRKFTKKRLMIGGLIAVAIGGGVYYRLSRKQTPSLELVLVQRGTVAQEVSVTGRVKAAADVDLAFEVSGRVSRVAADVGTTVQTGDPLVVLDSQELAASLAKAAAGVTSATSTRRQYQAALDTQRAELADLKSGTRPEELAVSRAQVAAAEQALQDAKTNLANVAHQNDVSLANLYSSVANTINTAYLNADDAVYKQIDPLFAQSTGTPSLIYTSSDSQAKIDAESGRQRMNTVLPKFQAAVSHLGSDYAVLDQALKDADSYLTDVSMFLVRLGDTMNVATSLAQSTLGTYKGYVNTARTNVATALTSVRTATQVIASQKATNQQTTAATAATVSKDQNDLTVARQQLALKVAGPTADALAAKEAAVRQAEANASAQQAAIEQAQANVVNLQAQLAKLTLRSPIGGVVTRQDAKVGEMVAPNVTVASVISASTFQVEADVPEADIAKVHVGDAAHITLDAYGDDVTFEATVVKVDPAERILDGVATYKVTLQFTKSDDRVKSGMTANITTVGAKKENVLSIPQRLVITRSEEKYVKIFRNSTVVEVKITTGLRGSSGNIEVTSGLGAGDSLVVSGGTPD